MGLMPVDALLMLPLPHSLQMTDRPWIEAPPTLGNPPVIGKQRYPTVPPLRYPPLPADKFHRDRFGFRPTEYTVVGYCAILMRPVMRPSVLKWQMTGRAWG